MFLQVRDVRKVLSQIALAVDYLHQRRIAHDIKLENVLLFGKVAKLADFGFAI